MHQGAWARLRWVSAKIGPSVLYALAILVAGACAAGLSLAIYKALPHRGFVRELTVAGGVYLDQNKLRDIYIVPIALGLQICLIAGTLWVLRTAWCRRAFAEVARRLDLVIVAAAAISVGALAVNVQGWSFYIGTPLLFAGALAAYARAPERAPLVCLTALMAGCLAGWGVNLFGLIDVSAPFFAAGLATGAVLCAKPVPPRVRESAFLVLGCALIAAGASIAPIFWLGRGLTALDILVWCPCLLAAAALWRWQARGRPASLPLLPLCLGVALLLTDRSNLTVISSDDYHYGELLLATKALAEGSILLSYLTPHGLSDALGAFGYLAYGDRTATGVQFGVQYGVYFLAIATAWFATRRLGPVLGVALAASCIVWAPAGALAALLLFLVILSAGGIRRHALAGAGLAISSAGTIVFLGGTGVPIAISAALLAVLERQIDLRSASGRIALAKIAAGGIAAAGLLFLVFGRQMLGEMFFIQVSAATNLFVYGNNFIARPSLEILTGLAFIAVPVLAAALAGPPAALDTAPAKAIARAVLALAPLVVLALLLAPYAMGRLDMAAPRASFATSVCLAVLAVWLRSPGPSRAFARRPQAGHRVAQGVVILIMGVTALLFPTYVERWDKASLMPPRPLPAAGHGIASAGSAAMFPDHLHLVRNVGGAVASLLQPDETFLDLTNRIGLYFYLNRMPPWPVASVYNAAPTAFQKTNLDAVRAAPPPLAIVDATSFLHDGYSFPLRTFDIYKWVVSTYVPVSDGRSVYGLRRDVAGRAAALPQLPVPVLQVTDANWTAGIAKGANPWSFAATGETARRLRVGQRLQFSDGTVRTITALENTNVRTLPSLEGMDGTTASFSILDAPAQDSMALWAQVFHLENLGQVPSAWGRSAAKLKGAIKPDAVALAPSGGAGIYAVPPGVKPYDTGLLALDLSCASGQTPPRIDVAWRTAQGDFDTDRNVFFHASYRANLVPLDASPRWLLADRVAEIRIRVSPSPACPNVEILNPRLLSRATDGG